MKLLSISAAALVLSLVFLGATVYAAPSLSGSTASTESVCQPTANPFEVTGTIWGTTTSPISAGPGDQDVPLTVTLIYSGPCTATTASFELKLPQQFAATDGLNHTTTYEVNISPDTALSETYYININSSAPLANYDLPVFIGYNTSYYESLFYQSTDAPVALRGAVALAFTPNVTTLYAGVLNNVTVSISNQGTGKATSIVPSVSTVSQVGILNRLSDLQSLSPNATVSQQLQIYVPSSLAGSSVSLSFSASYYDAYSVARTLTQTAGFLVSTAQPLASIVFASSVTSLSAGEINNLTISISNVGSGSASSISLSVAAPSQVSILNLLSFVPSLDSGAAVSQTLQVFVPSSLSGSALSLTFTSAYQDSFSVGHTTSQIIGFYISSGKPSSPFVVDSVQWGTSSLSPQPGDRNVPLVLSVQYLGTAVATNVVSTLNLPAGFTSQNGLSDLSVYAPTVNPNQSFVLTFYLDIGQGVEPAGYSFLLSLTWGASTPSTFSESVTVSPPAIGATTVPSTPSFTLSELNDSVVTGTPGRITFNLTNGGTGSVYSTGFALTVGSPLVLMGGSPSAPVSVVKPAESVLYSVLIGSSPSATAGVYSGTVSVTFTDLSGTQHTQSFSVGFTLTGDVELVVQDEQVTQSSSGVTVTGSLLNEGTGTAYYAQVTGSVNGAPTGNETADYVGEIDPNTPTPFTVTVPYSAPNSAQPNATVVLSVSFKNNFGTLSTSTSSMQTHLKSAEQLFLTSFTTTGGSESGSGQSLVTLISYTIVVVIVVSCVIGALVVRRRRSSGKPKREERVI